MTYKSGQQQSHPTPVLMCLGDKNKHFYTETESRTVACKTDAVQINLYTICE